MSANNSRTSSVYGGGGGGANGEHSSRKEVQPIKFPPKHRDRHRDERSKSSSPRRHNKIYRTPPTPPPEKLLVKEKSFTLDSIATHSIASDYFHANPKLGPVIPPYNSQRDRHVKTYFKFQGVDRTLDRTEQDQGGTSIEGPVMDRFNTAGSGHSYLYLRNQFGAGHSREQVDGHAQFMQGLKPITGYHGPFGYRRNTPWLRQSPSNFGVGTRSSIH